MSFFYDGQDPEYNKELILKESTTQLLNIRDLCLLMRHTRFSAKSLVEGSSEFNQLQLEIWFLEKIIRIIDLILIDRFTTEKDSKQFYSETLESDLKLNNIVPGNYFDKKNIIDNCYEVVKKAKKMFANFNRVVAEDWKFL